MKTPKAAPQTLLQAVQHFANPDAALAFMVSLRWPDGVVCPHCTGLEVTFMQKRRVWQCKAKACRKQFSAKVGTIFEDSPITLDKWLPAVWMIANDKNGISSYELHRALGVTQKTAWFMLHRIRLAMQTKAFGKFGGDVEADETFIGGRSRFMHHGKRERVIKTPGVWGKAAVMGLLERTSPEKQSTVRLSVTKSLRKHAIQDNIHANVEPGSNLYTDKMRSYQGLEEQYIHGVIDHGKAYVRGKVHTNGLENFWSLLKRSIKGTYVSIEPFHLFRYLDEQSFRFNNRKDNDAGRFVEVLRAIVGKRVTYKALTGNQLPETC
jgi:transposase-like protein